MEQNDSNTYADQYNMDKNLIAEFDSDPAAAMKEMESSMGPVKEILTHPDLRELVRESRIPEMLEHDLGESAKLGNSKAIRSALADAARKIEWRRSQLYGDNSLYQHTFVTRQQEKAFRQECLSIIKTSLMQGRSEFIRKTGKALPGW